MLCGNGSGARLCPAGYVCLPGIGDNPNYGYTSFDTFLWSMLTTFQLITLDFWEDVYNKIIAAMGPWSILFFGLVVFFGSFYLINLMLAVVAMSYEEEAENTEEEKVKDLADHRDDSTFSFDPSNLKLHRLDKDSKFPTIRLKNHTIFASYKYNKKKKKKKAKGRKSVEGGVTKEDDSCVSADGHVSAVSPAGRRVSELHDEHETNELRPRALVHELLSPDPRPVVVELPGAIRTPSVSPQRKQSSSSDRYAAAAQDPTEVSCDSSALNVRALPPSPIPAAAPPTTEAHPLRSSCEQLEATEKTSVQMFHGGELDEYYVHITTGQQPLGPAGSRGALDCTPTGDAADELAGLEDAGLDEDAVSPLAGHRSQGGGRREALRHAMFATSVESQGIGEMRGNSDSSTSEHRSAGDVRRLGMRECSLDDSGVVGDQETMSERGKNMMIRTEDITPLAKALDLEVTLTEKKCNGISPQRRSPSPSYVSHVVELHDETPDRNCDCCSSCCIWYETWLRWQNRLHLLVTDPCFDVFITLCIILNTAFLALEHYGMSNEMRQTLEIGNRVFTSIFTLECTLKVIAISKEFFRSGWNIFDLIVVVASLVELSLQNINGLSVLRVLRLLRVLKLAQSWTTMRVLLSIIISSLGALGNLTFVLVIVIYIFAVIGMQLFSNSYTADIFEPDPVPRWNFNDFFHSFMMIFRILCGEWIEPLWDCMRAKREESEMCLAVFLPALVMGNFLVLNLFLALLLNSFNCEELRTRKEGQVAPHGGPGIDLVTLRRRLRYLRRRLVPPAGRRASQPSPRPARRMELRAELKTSSLSEGLDRECASASTMRSHAGRTASPLLRESSADRMKGCTGCDQLPNEYTAQQRSDGKKHISPGCSALGSSQEAKGKSKLVQSVQRLKGYIRSHRDPESRQREVIAAFESARVDQPARCALPPLPVSVSVPEIRRTLDETDLLSDSSDPLQAGYKQINAEVGPPVTRLAPPAGTGGVFKSPSTVSNWSTLATYVESLRGRDQTGSKPEPTAEQQQQQRKREPNDCFPVGCYNRFPCCQAFTRTPVYRRWHRFRTVVVRFVDNSYFEWVVLVMIIASSIALCFEDKYLYQRPQLKRYLRWANLVFASLFTVEMVLKWVAFGLKKYYSNAWTILDFIIVVASIFSLAIEENETLVALRSLRTLRALRPLRAISRWQGMKIVVNALMFAIPSIFNVLLVCLVFWLIFSIMGVQFFSGQFYKCVDDDGERLPVSVVNDRNDCGRLNYTWVNSKISFDNVGIAYLALFQVATFEGWMEVMADAVDARGEGMQPEREANLYAYIYFVVFIVCGSFFTLNLFIGVIIDNFNMLKKKYEGGVLEMFLTDSQKNYYTALKKLGRKKPQKVIRRPLNHYHALFYDIAVSRRFEIAIFVMIFLNMVIMGIEHYGQPSSVASVLELFNILFTTIFSLEALVKIIGLRLHYFTVPWNLFDFILVGLSIFSLVIEAEHFNTEFPIPPTLLRVVRVFRIGRILRLIKAAKGIRKLLFALIVSLPALFNIGALLFLVMFIYAIIGIALFANIRHSGVINDIMNFETFGNSMILLFRLITSAGWNDVLDPLMAQPPDCDPNLTAENGDILPYGDCGQPLFAIIYFVTFIVINFMIVINMYIAVILENFNQAHQEEEIGIVEEDLEMFYVRWAKYDPHATQFINFSQLSDFIASLDPPLGIAKPNTVALVSFNLPIARGDKIHCLDILHALTKHVLGHVEETEEFHKLQEQMNEKFKKQFPTRKELEIVSSTRQWKQMDLAARIIQRALKAFCRRKRERERLALTLDDSQTQTSPGRSPTTPMFLQRVASYLHVPALMAGGRRSRTGSVASSTSRPGSRASGDSADSSRRSSYHLGESFSRIGVLGAGLPGLGIVGFDVLERRDSGRRRGGGGGDGSAGGSMSRISELPPPQVQIHEVDEDASS
ncbi:sodium channel protein 60E-like isoform X2 [Amphibalanus amphitrite]|uniref:sodium channel protein 60E-like isoform X2 n=1 Tax=Amphibalanus amphitrite TaxID=1232801 RepID=UPI001C8FDF80|nr:sodium channel protein 60E-like isoform X2 [Amphibalanus amphitrite]